VPSSQLNGDATLISQRRRTPRYPFAAQAEVTEPISDKRIFARVKEISMNGCYLDMRDPLPTGKQIFVKIFTATDFFESSATVIYSQSNLGMGLAFREVSPHFMPTMHKWLLEAMRESNEIASKPTT
jgi:hypothetical protein